MSKPFYVYLLRCSDGSIYVGQTDDLDQRMAEHQAGLGCAYTQQRQPVVLCWSATFATRDEAKAVEHQLKGWSRRKKEALIQEDWSTIHDAARKPRRDA